MKEIRSTADIHSTPERVWQVLTDFAAYRHWNPFITSASGKAVTGERLELRMEPPGAMSRTVRPTVLEADGPRELRWHSEGLVSGLLDEHHCITIVNKGPNRTHVIQRSTFTGLLLPFNTARIETNLREGYETMNRALKQRVQS
jgi:hypothetical protein